MPISQKVFGTEIIKRVYQFHMKLASQYPNTVLLNTLRKEFYLVGFFHQVLRCCHEESSVINFNDNKNGRFLLSPESLCYLANIAKTTLTNKIRALGLKKWLKVKTRAALAEDLS